RRGPRNRSPIRVAVRRNSGDGVGPKPVEMWPAITLGAVSTLPSPGMTANFLNMITDEIKELMHAAPFRPVRIVLGNQQSFVVAHTDYLMVSPDRQTVVLYDKL